MKIARPNQVWCADITYIPQAKGFLTGPEVTGDKWVGRDPEWPLSALILMIADFAADCRTAVIAGLRNVVAQLPTEIAQTRELFVTRDVGSSRVAGRHDATSGGLVERPQQ